MSFWGIEVKSDKVFPYHSKNVGGKLRVTQATLGSGSSTEKSIVQCFVGDKSPVFLCSLLPGKIETCPLNLEFDETDVVIFKVLGPRSVHLSGFLEVYSPDSIEDDYGEDVYDSDSFGEDIAETETETEESTDYDTEDEYDIDFIDDDDFQMFPPSPVANSGVVIEEILDDVKPENTNNRGKRLKKKNQSEADNNGNSEKQIVVKSSSGVPVLESEDEDGFPISAAHKSKPNAQKPKAETEKKMEQRTAKETKKKRRRDDADADRSRISESRDNINIKDGQPESGTNQPIDSAHPCGGAPENDVKKKNKKKNKKQKEASKEIKGLEAGRDNESNALPAKDEQNQKLTNEKNLDIDSDLVLNGNRSVEKQKKKNKKKNKSQESGEDAGNGQTVTSVGDANTSTVALEEKKDNSKPAQVRTFPNGLVIEELAMGKPDGKRASPGNQVSVHYIGKLKKDGSIFDSNVGRAPFKFRLGVGQVIKGWDVGVNGMRVGDKRRLTIPPSMGYGAQGAGKKIPPNSWLVFDVELVNVR